jgi:hypothetical protein
MMNDLFYSGVTPVFTCTREEEIYMSKLTEVNSHEQVFSKLWTECQHCQVRLTAQH